MPSRSPRSRRPSARRPTDNNATKASQAATFTYAANGLGLVGYGPGATCGVNGIGCFTRNAPDGGFTMWLREHGRVFDWGTLKWCQMYASPPNGCYDAETIALDEFGHIQGLDHHVNHDDDRDYIDAVVQTFSRTRPSSGWNMHVYGRCDVATLQLRYDMRQLDDARTRPASTSTTTLTLSASPTSIAYGGTTRLTAMLKVADVGAYYRLEDQPDQRADGPAPAPSARRHDVDDGRHDARHGRVRHLLADPEAADRRRVPGDVHGAVERRPRAATRAAPSACRVADCTGSCPLVRPGRRGGERVRAGRGTPVLGLAILAVVVACAGPSPSPTPSGVPDPTATATIVAVRRRPGDADRRASDGRRGVTGVGVARGRRARAAGGQPRGGGRRPGRRPARDLYLGGRRVGLAVAPGAPITVGAVEPLAMTVDPAVPIATWSARMMPIGATAPAGAVSLGRGAGPPRFDAPGPGDWTVEVQVRFADGLGSASYFWALTST